MDNRTPLRDFTASLQDLLSRRREDLVSLCWRVWPGRGGSAQANDMASIGWEGDVTTVLRLRNRETTNISLELETAVRMAARYRLTKDRNRATRLLARGLE